MNEKKRKVVSHSESAMHRTIVVVARHGKTLLAATPDRFMWSLAGALSTFLETSVDLRSDNWIHLEEAVSSSRPNVDTTTRRSVASASDVLPADLLKPRSI